MRLIVISRRPKVFLLLKQSDFGLFGYPAHEPLFPFSFIYLFFAFSTLNVKREVWLSFVCYSDTNYVNYYRI